MASDFLTQELLNIQASSLRRTLIAKRRNLPEGSERPWHPRSTAHGKRKLLLLGCGLKADF
jgi:hypothetical protein